jgi:hypothetical protein
MSDKKTIKVNMELFDLPGKTRKKKDPAEKKDIKIKNNQHNKTTKNKLLRYIREQQEKNYEKLFESSSSSSNKQEKEISPPQVLANSNSDFEKSVAYMKTVEEEKKKKDQVHKNINTNSLTNVAATSIFTSTGSNTNNNANTLGIQQSSIANQTIKHKSYILENQTPVLLNSYPNILENIQVSSKNDPILLKQREIPTPTYGCLKNGNIPTYRSMLQQTMKNNTSPRITLNTTMPHINTNVPNIPNKLSGTAAHENINIKMPLETSEKLKNDHLKAISEINQLRMRINESKSGQLISKNAKYLKRKKTLRRTYNVGKSKVHRNVSVLVTNRTIRKNISTQAQKLKTIPIEEIRKYLTQKGFIKVGSIAPNDVLRQMYENTVLIGGDIQNHNPENLLYNYLNDQSDIHGSSHH